MTQSLAVKRSLERMRKGLGWSAGLLLLIAVILLLVVPGLPWLAVLVGLVAGLAMFVVSGFSTTRMAQGPHLGIGWLALDYVAKVLIVAAALLLAKYALHLNVAVVAALVLGSVALGAIIQVWAFSPSASAQTERIDS